MKKLAIGLLFCPLLGIAQVNKSTVNQWDKKAKRVEIIRDQWGIPHIYGKKDADCVFGLMYAQSEDDFYRIESNYIDVLGRRAEVEGVTAFYADLYKKLVYDADAAKEDYTKAPAWLKELLDAWADGMNYFLYKNPQIKPKLLTHFEPWFPLMWTDGSIGSINTAGFTARDIEGFYREQKEVAYQPAVPIDEIHDGSNGFAFTPSKTTSGNAILYINPHTTFYFRPEVHMISEEGLNAYGAVTWGQFFVYQGFNDFCGWMHTSGYTDVADSYYLDIKNENGKYFYKYEGVWKPVIEKEITVRFKSGNGLETKKIKTYASHHGPVMGIRQAKWIAVKANNRDMNGLIQSWKRTKVQSFEEFKSVMDLRANTSNNTVYADKAGNIAYYHGNYIPVRDTAYDWSKPVDGSVKATEWKGLHDIASTVHYINPANGWIQNCNSTPFTATGKNSLSPSLFPAYMKTDVENFRGINAVAILEKTGKLSLDDVIHQVGYNTYLPAFEYLVPGIIKHYKEVSVASSQYAHLKEVVDSLYAWNYHSAVNSIATNVAIEFAQALQSPIAKLKGNMIEKYQQFANVFPAERTVSLLDSVVKLIEKRNGTWKTTWGSVNRFQRISNSVENVFDDQQPSIPVAFAAATWGSLPSYVSRYNENGSKRYGYSGNSFVAAIEFGEKIIAKTVLSGGVSGDPGSKHFNDQASLFANGQFKVINFYKEDVLKNAERKYQPGKK